LQAVSASAKVLNGEPMTLCAYLTLLSLNRLPPPQRAETIVGVTSGKRLPKEVADQIVDRTDGVDVAKYSEQPTTHDCADYSQDDVPD
jgi:hypothetical protein